MIEKDYKEKARKVVDAVVNVLKEKNKRYGNAALQPINVFYKGDGVTSIEIRLDDKISRVLNADTIRKNDLFDILGYLYLYSISKEWFIDSSVFNIQVIDISDAILNDYVYKDYTISLFNKENNVLSQIDHIITIIKYSQPTEQLVGLLIASIVRYFVENNITDFTDLID